MFNAQSDFMGLRCGILTAILDDVTWGGFKKVYGLLNLRALKFSPVNKMHIFVCVEFQREASKFHTKYLTHTLKDPGGGGGTTGQNQ